MVLLHVEVYDFLCFLCTLDAATLLNVINRYRLVCLRPLCPMSSKVLEEPLIQICGVANILFTTL